MGEALLVRRGGTGKSEGLNVWTKATSELYVTAKITGKSQGIAEEKINGSSKFHFVIPLETSNTKIPLSSLTSANLIGLKVELNNSNNSYRSIILEITSETECVETIPQAGSTYNGTYTYDATLGKIVTSFTSDNGDRIIKETITSITIDRSGTLLAYVVNDDPSAYPTDGIHTDGYYYALLGQVTSENVIGLSANALEIVQSDYREQIVSEVSEIGYDA